ncbi:helix-turn-helix domain-containing protein [Phototrophicus methaneseepsis]|uniref:Helix-turn-helix domain-containing protein n=1 Tax=Phototrophicus methaneseepsis TaxID=2710758 RepID=A0A7S8ICQ7_9CHLR|nr:helix-turn-helix domain-containing protein [Phototrophicus methaneseepsis]QPC80731.1 helix-turn-helix domain-containing protein [Phototrophicus methaneseepsis]
MVTPTSSNLTTSNKNTATLRSLLRYALPLNSTIAVGDPDTAINWAVVVRAQPASYPEIYGGELALLSMEVLRIYEARITLQNVIRTLADSGIQAIAVEGDMTQQDMDVATECGVALLMLPEGTGLASVERAVNRLIVNQSAQVNERAIDIQRQLTRLAAENRDLSSLLQVMVRATTKPMVVHDDAGVLIAQAYPAVGRRATGRNLVQSVPYSAFQKWLKGDAPTSQGTISSSPIGYTTVLKVEKRVAGYLSLLEQGDDLDEFDQLVLTYGADVCAIELAKNRAISAAVEQARGDWIQMWLSGTPADDDLLRTRAQQSGFDPNVPYVVSVFRAVSANGQTLPLESLISLVRDDMARRQVEGAVGQYVDVIVTLYPMEDASSLARIRIAIDELRQQLATRTPSGLVAAGISRPAEGLSMLRDAYREAKDAVSIAGELNDMEHTTFYGDLKLYQLLLALKERSLTNLHQFYEETLAPLVEHDERKQSDLIRTLDGFFNANGNLAKAAQDLDVHRNTLVYRLERISELTNLDLNDADNRLILHLALKVQRVLSAVRVN